MSIPWRLTVEKVELVDLPVGEYDPVAHAKEHYAAFSGGRFAALVQSAA